MGNMSYCRFRNTLGDLRDCYDHLSDKSWNEEARDEDKDNIENEMLSFEETQARKKLIELCKEITEQYSEDD